MENTGNGCQHNSKHIANIANRTALYVCNDCLLVWLEVKNIHNDKDAKRTVILKTNLTEVEVEPAYVSDNVAGDHTLTVEAPS